MSTYQNEWYIYLPGILKMASWYGVTKEASLSS